MSERTRALEAAKLETAKTEPDESTLRSSIELGNDPAFQRRVQAACVFAAVEVAAEDAKTTNHPRRTELAGQVLRSPEAWGKMIAQAVASNVTIVGNAMAGTEIPDGDIQFVVNGLWDAYAGTA